MKQFIFLFWCFCFSFSGIAQEVFNQSFASAGVQHFLVSNISGGIEIKESASNQIKVQATLEDGSMLKGVSVDFKQGPDYLLVYLRTPCSQDKSSMTFDPKDPTKMNNWKGDCDWEQKKGIKKIPTIKYRIDLPNNINLTALTIMDGDIKVSNFSGNIWANNINGGIQLEQIVYLQEAKTINGDIKISYQKKPSLDALFSSINGDIEIAVPSGTSTTASFKTFNGDFYTDIESINFLPELLIEENHENGFKVKVEKKRRMEINGGGIKLDFDTFNGSVYLTTGK